VPSERHRAVASHAARTARLCMRSPRSAAAFCLLIAPTLPSQEPRSTECVLPTAAAADAVQLRSDIVYRVTGSDTLRLDLAQPTGRGSRPLVVIVHGGGWRAGSKSERLAPVVRRVAAAGFTVASVDYRLTNGEVNRFPTALEDVWCAVAFLRSRAREYGFDGTRIAIAGESAGGQLSTLTALAPAIAGRACADDGLVGSVRGLVGMYGIYDFLALDGQPRAADAVVGYLGAQPSQDSALARRASPVQHVSSRTAPVLLIHGTADRSVSVDQSRRLRDAVRRAGVDAELIEVPGQDHGFEMVSESPALRVSSCAVLGFLIRHLTP
jgi:acetyl esterase/lipase